MLYFLHYPCSIRQKLSIGVLSTPTACFIVAIESILRTMYVAPIASASPASFTVTVLQENLVVMLLTNVPLVVLDNRVLTMVTVLQENAVILIANVIQEIAV